MMRGRSTRTYCPAGGCRRPLHPAPGRPLEVGPGPSVANAPWMAGETTPHLLIRNHQKTLGPRLSRNVCASLTPSPTKSWTSGKTCKGQPPDPSHRRNACAGHRTGPWTCPPLVADEYWSRKSWTTAPKKTKPTTSTKKSSNPSGTRCSSPSNPHTMGNQVPRQVATCTRRENFPPVDVLGRRPAREAPLLPAVRRRHHTMPDHSMKRPR